MKGLGASERGRKTKVLTGSKGVHLLDRERENSQRREQASRWLDEERYTAHLSMDSEGISLMSLRGRREE
jgi:hypothetical protein